MAGKRHRAPTALAAAACFCAAIALPAAPSFGQTDDPTLSGQAYLDAVRSRGIQAEIAYAPDDIAPQPEAPEPEQPADPESTADPDAVRWIVLGLFATILLFLVALAARNGVGVGIAFGGRSKEAPSRREKSGRRSPGPPAPVTPGEVFLTELGAMADRREALHRLLVRALANSATLTGLRPGRSWTARDVIRALPEGWPHLPALRQIVGQAEIAWFGGRDVGADALATCLERARPIILSPGRS